MWFSKQIKTKKSWCRDYSGNPKISLEANFPFILNTLTDAHPKLKVAWNQQWGREIYWIDTMLKELLKHLLDGTIIRLKIWVHNKLFYKKTQIFTFWNVCLSVWSRTQTFWESCILKWVEKTIELTSC